MLPRLPLSCFLPRNPRCLHAAGTGDGFAQSASRVRSPAEPAAPSSSSRHPESSTCSGGCCQCQRPLRPGPSSCTTGRRWNLILSKTETSPRVSTESRSWKERSFHPLSPPGQARRGLGHMGAAHHTQHRLGGAAGHPLGKGNVGTPSAMSCVVVRCCSLFSCIFPPSFSPRCLILWY